MNPLKRVLALAGAIFGLWPLAAMAERLNRPGDHVIAKGMHDAFGSADNSIFSNENLYIIGLVLAVGVLVILVAVTIFKKDTQ